MTWSEIADEIIANRQRRGWRSAHDIAPSLAGLLEELGELEEAWAAKDADACIDALCDIAVYGIGAMRILGVDSLAFNAIAPIRAAFDRDSPMLGPLLRYAGRLAKAHKSGDSYTALNAAIELVEHAILCLQQLVLDPRETIARVVRQNATRTHTGTHG